MADIINQIEKLMKTKQLIIGSARTIKNLKLGRIETVYLAKNCPSSIKEDIKYYSSLSNTNVNELEQNNEELGALCKKPFFISVVSALKKG